MEAKFKPTQTVRVAYAKDHKFNIKEVVMQTCPGGTQIHYIGRLIVTNGLGRGISDKAWDFLEHELEALPDEKTLRELEAKVEELSMKKDAYLKTQDFEKAAQCREEEKRIREEINSLNK